MIRKIQLDDIFVTDEMPMVIVRAMGSSTALQAAMVILEVSILKRRIIWGQRALAPPRHVRPRLVGAEDPLHRILRLSLARPLDVRIPVRTGGTICVEAPDT